MWIEFSLEEHQRRIVELPIKQRLPLIQAIPLLEEANREVLAIEKEITVDYAIYMDGETPQATMEATLLLPLENKTVIEAIQSHAQAANEEVNSEESRAFLTKLERTLPKSKKRMPTVKKHILETRQGQEATRKREIFQGPYPKGRTTGTFVLLFKGIGLFCLLLLLLLTGIVIAHSLQQEPLLSKEGRERLDVLEIQVEKQTQMDTFSRFFLTNYYTGETEAAKVQEKIQGFVDKEALNDFQGTEEQVKSIFPWEATRKGSTWQVSYVIIVETNQGRTQTKQVTFSIQEHKKQYKVLTVPKEASFEIIP